MFPHDYFPADYFPGDHFPPIVGGRAGHPPRRRSPVVREPEQPDYINDDNDFLAMLL